MADTQELLNAVPVLSRSLVVVLARTGLGVPDPQGWTIPVDLTRLRLLARAAAGEDHTLGQLIDDVVGRGPQARLATAMFVQSLHAAGLLHPGPHPPPGAGAGALDHPDRVLAVQRQQADEPEAEPVVAEPVVAEPVVAEPVAAEPVVAEAPVVFEVGADGFVLCDHGGAVRARLDPVELDALASLLEPTTLARALEGHQQSAGPLALDRDSFAGLVHRLRAGGVVYHHDGNDPLHVVALGVGRLMARNEATAHARLQEVIDALVAEHERAEAERRAATGRSRPKVVPVTFNGTLPPLALGLIVSHAKAFEGGRLDEHYDFHPGWLTDEERLAAVAREPGIFLFSNYVWSHERCLAASEMVRRLNPASITVHGGPSTPKYPGDVEEYFARFPHVDVVVHGEGEQTATEVLAALTGVFDSDDRDLSPLGDVPGLSFRHGDRIVRTPDRDRITDLDSIPSPYLTGLFDAYAEVPRLSVTIETNRGCPYGCTFCDWGSATLSRIRKFDLDRVKAELTWCARNQVISVGLTDANFGIWERDVEITEFVVDLKKRYGFPTGFGANYAKNTTKHLRHIIEMLVKAGILSQGVLALQSMDPVTLDAIERSNIRVDKYEELAREFRKAQLPLFVDLMVGLPGQTIESFEADLQQCVDREVQARLPITQMLVNSPMNEPSYRERFAIELTSSPVGADQPRVIATSSFTEDQYELMLRMRTLFILAENLGVLRQVARVVRSVTGTREVHFYRRLLHDVESEPERWPHLTIAVKIVPVVMAPPVSWSAMIDELRRYLVDRVGLADDSTLDTVLAVQHALLPARDRRLPEKVALPHDYPAWFDRMLEAKESGHRDDWEQTVPPLSDFPPASMVVDDRNGSVTYAGIGAPLEFHGTGLHWELDSPMARFAIDDDETIAELIVTT